VQLSDLERRAWLRLARSENVGPVTFRNLVARFGSASAALHELPRLAQRGGNRNFVPSPEEDSARELEGLAKLGGRLIAACEPDYPPGLKALEAPPPSVRIEAAGRRPNGCCCMAEPPWAGAQAAVASLPASPRGTPCFSGKPAGGRHDTKDWVVGKFAVRVSR
jgi:hypothetical protein